MQWQPFRFDTVEVAVLGQVRTTLSLSLLNPSRVAEASDRVKALLAEARLAALLPHFAEDTSAGVEAKIAGFGATILVGRCRVSQFAAFLFVKSAGSMSIHVPE